MSALRFLFTEIIYNGHFQTWGSLAIVIFSGQLLDIKIGIDLLLIVYLAFYIIYIHDRYRGIEIDALTNLKRSGHVKRIYKYIPFIIISGLLILAALLYFFGNIYVSIFIGLLIGFGFLYPLYFKGLTKRVVIFKNIYVASVFSALVALPPIYYFSEREKLSSLLIIGLLLFAFLRGVMMQIHLDLKDIEGDKTVGLKTLGVLLGKEKTINILKILAFVTPLFLPFLYFVYPGVFPRAVLFLILLIPINFYYIKLAKNNNPASFVLISGEFISWPILIFIGSFFKQ